MHVVVLEVEDQVCWNVSKHGFSQLDQCIKPYSQALIFLSPSFVSGNLGYNLR